MRTYGSREEQLAALNRMLLRIGVALLGLALAYELLTGSGFSVRRLGLMAAAIVAGLLVGRTVGRTLFLIRR